MGRDRKRKVEVIRVFGVDEFGVEEFGVEASHGAVSTRATPAPVAPAPPGRPPWAMPIAGLAALAVAAAALLWSSDDESTRPPDSVAPSTTVRPLLSATDAPQRFVVDPPAGWSFSSADLLSPIDDSSWFGLWAAPGATATDGRWLALTLTPGTRRADAAVDATRSLVDGYEASSPITDPGLRRVVVPLDDSSVTLLARGLDDTTLGAIARGMTPPEFKGDPPDVEVPDDLVATGAGPDPAGVGGGDPETSVVYTQDDPQGTPVDVTLTVGRLARITNGTDIGIDAGVPALRTLLLDPLGWRGTATVMTADGPEWWTGRLLERPGQRVLRWSDGEHVFELEGPVNFGTLQSFAAAVRVAGDLEWERLLYSRRPGLQLGPLLQVGAGSTTDGSGWTAGLRLAERDGTMLFGWAAAPLDTPGGPPYGVLPSQPLPDLPTVTSLVIPGATYVFASTPPTGREQVLRVSFGDTTVDVPFVPLVHPDRLLVAGYAFSEPVAFTAEVV